jgi:hypothetical protein
VQSFLHGRELRRRSGVEMLVWLTNERLVRFFGRFEKLWSSILVEKASSVR